MKNCEEMVASLLARRERYVAAQKKKRKAIAGAAACCVCLAVLAGFGLRPGGWFRAAQPGQTVQDAVYPGIKDTFDESKGESPEKPAANDKIVVNRISGVAADRVGVPLNDADFVEMTLAEMAEYYGVDYVPELPADILPRSDERHGIYRRDGEVYWDADIQNYSNRDFTRTVHLEAAKENRILKDCLYFQETEKKSVINNIELFIGVTAGGYYYAEFQYQSVEFLISANGVTLEEFTAILSSILN